MEVSGSRATRSEMFHFLHPAKPNLPGLVKGISACLHWIKADSGEMKTIQKFKRGNFVRDFSARVFLKTGERIDVFVTTVVACG
jgi:hypothetical protein